MIKTETVLSCLVCDSDSSEEIEKCATMMGNDHEQWSFRKCSVCDMVYLSPRVKMENLDKYYTNAYLPYRGASAWGKYADLVAGDQIKIDKKRLGTILKYISNNTKTILDVGCGKPSFLKLVQENTGMRSVGLDFSDNGWNDDGDLYSSLDLYVGSVKDLPDNVEADVITMWHYLEHDYKPKETLQTLSDRHKKDTLLIIEVPNHDSYTRRKYTNNWSGYHTPRHTGLYTPKTMKLLLESSGWNIVNQYTYGTLDPYTLDWMSRMEQKGIDWTSSMEPHFFEYVFGKIMRPQYYLHKYKNQGFFTTIARKN